MIDARIAALLDRLAGAIVEYPAHAVSRVPAFALGTAFFPVGAGLVDPAGPLPDDAIMIVAHVFDAPSVAYVFGEGGGSERIAGNRTWRGLLALLERADVDPRRCFLTNAYMGAKVGAPCGPVGGGRAYRAACEAFLGEQVRVVRPRVVATLGRPAALALRAASADLTRRWAGVARLADLDCEPARMFQRDVAFADVVVPRVVALGHTCSWTSRRLYAGELGAKADAALLHDAAADVTSSATRHSPS